MTRPTALTLLAAAGGSAVAAAEIAAGRMGPWWITLDALAALAWLWWGGRVGLSAAVHGSAGRAVQ